MATGLFEIKFDGYRILARIERGKVTLLTRGGHDWTEQDARTGARRSRPRACDRAWLDGEIVVSATTACPTSTHCRTPSTRRAADDIDLLRLRRALPRWQGPARRAAAPAARHAEGAARSADALDHIRFSARLRRDPRQHLWRPRRDRAGRRRSPSAPMRRTSRPAPRPG
ncbi:MAG: hypothetical protein QM749_17410 [Aquabacterium sp.]